jgi:glucosamine 6-phosphate synthetase-like amidotransferase/phosphosugar isomerase protein
MGIVAEFARYKAKLVNHFWAVSALTDTELVASLWEHHIKVVGRQWVYEDHLSRWSGNGNKLMGQHLATALADGRPVRIVKATTDNIALIEGGGDGSKANNTFKARPEWIGKVTAFDGDAFTIVFDRIRDSGLVT